MKRLLIVVLVMAAAWAGYWFLASSQIKGELTNWFQQQREQGWVAEYSDLTVTGFPNRVDTTFTNLTLADPETGWAWDVPFFQLMALSYKPNHIIAVWPNDQRLATPLQKLSISSAELKASVVLQADEALPLDRANLVADTLTIATEGGQATTMTALRAAIQSLPDDPNSYRFAIETDDFAPPMQFRGLIGAADHLPRTFDALRAQLSVTFDNRWDRAAIEHRRPQPRHIDLQLVEARWGDLELMLAGAADVDNQGRLSGSMTIKARNWQEIVNMAVASGQLSLTMAERLSNAFKLLSQMTGNPKTLDIPLDFRNGTIYLGPVPVAKMPRLVLR